MTLNITGYIDQPYWQTSRYAEDVVNNNQIKAQATCLFPKNAIVKIHDRIAELRAQLVCSSDVSAQLDLLQETEDLLLKEI